ncbi:hypothetical protein SKAU_G00311430 [Synaphobranchus kaupii]|uniref:Uncharacterized protein n=1 Tax=Synaphobranchus kaupii TaxID=118154 RepID=A0A9Q1ERY3_SYNKA|nr:hypothetical protein SKAU_G00311430 [Synaphobranchus kaupii]
MELNRCRPDRDQTSLNSLISCLAAPNDMLRTSGSQLGGRGARSLRTVRPGSDCGREQRRQNASAILHLRRVSRRPGTPPASISTHRRERCFQSDLGTQQQGVTRWGGVQRKYHLQRICSKATSDRGTCGDGPRFCDAVSVSVEGGWAGTAGRKGEWTLAAGFDAARL